MTITNYLHKLVLGAILLSLVTACAQTPQRRSVRTASDTRYCEKPEHRTASMCQYQRDVERRRKTSDTANYTLQGLPKYYSSTSAKNASIRPKAAETPKKPQAKSLTSNSIASLQKQPSAANPEELWTRLAGQLRFNNLTDKEAVEEREEWYAEHAYYLANVSKRASRYIYYILENLEARDMPADLALLPFVESAYDPFAYSRGRASGLWQFIPNTAKHLGIEQNWWYDGRRDVITATDAALDYLSDLNKRFDGDWLLTLAAYNAGAGTVNKAITKNKKKGLPTDFWSLNLPKETENYVPKMLALVKIFRNPASYNLTLPKLANSEHFVAVDTGSQIDLAQAAKLAEISVDELYRLNPGFNRWVTAPDGPHRLLIPTKKSKTFRQRLAKVSPRDRVRWQRYKVQRGDNLIGISREHHVDVATLRASNQLDKDILQVGQVLLIPDAGNGLSPLKDLNRGQASSEASRLQHTVSRGDTISGIADKYGVNTAQINSWNKLASSATIRPGQKLVIWGKASNTSSQGIIRKVGYKVRNGDSLSLIASRFNLRIRDIAEWNSIKTSQYLRPGQSLTLYVDITHADL
ncbi:MAG: LysM peptidoglycan-binding domain-containing protein [Zhongshania sp.]|uniref:lytic transglycosylase n=1 Tax=Zhongshania sp. TaxID=1971902 RepID=UPI0026054DF5|nr:LysM peptidoglycan-binding domain-containing protein [Zhongshania sp.]MDF1691716.1 LysM peptidoglycan-binding domain-containing protein [Zhongshania sp.]